jgi:uncharacterized paraquat-inducible protein A
VSTTAATTKLNKHKHCKMCSVQTVSKITAKCPSVCDKPKLYENRPIKLEKILPYLQQPQTMTLDCAVCFSKFDT